MLAKLLFFFVLLGLLNVRPVLAQSPPNSVAAVGSQAVGAAPASYPAEDGFEPGLALFVLFALAVALVGIGAGVGLAVLATGLAIILLATGIITSAAIVGLWRRSWSAGLRTLLWLLWLLGSAGAGGVMAAGVNYIVSVTFTRDALAAGVGAGLLLGGLAAYTCQRLLALALAAWQRWLTAAPRRSVT